MTDSIKQKLIAAGLTRAKAESVTMEKMIDALMSDDAKILKEAELDLITKISGLVKKIQNADEFVSSLILTDEKAQNALSLYATILELNTSIFDDTFGAIQSETMMKCIDAASYVVYAYLGGQARRIYEVDKE